MLKKAPLFLVVLVAGAVCVKTVAAQGNGKHTIAALFDSSFAFESNGDLDRALGDVMQILRSDVQHYVANLRAGWLNYLKGNYVESISFYKKCTAFAPKAIEPKLGLMLPLMASGQWAYAQTIAEEILKVAPHDYTAASRLASIHYAQGRFKEAETRYGAVLKDYPSDLEMMLGLGWSRLKRGNKFGAKEMFDKVLEIRPKNVSAAAGLDAL